MVNLRRAVTGAAVPVAFLVAFLVAVSVALPVALPVAGAATSTTQPPKGKGLVHVKVTGSRKFVLDGTAVACQPGGGTTDVGLDGADFPELGKGGYLVVVVPLTSQFTPAVRARIGRTKYSTVDVQDQAKWKVSGRRVTFSKVDAAGGKGAIRVSGTVVCP